MAVSSLKEKCIVTAILMRFAYVKRSLYSFSMSIEPITARRGPIPTKPAEILAAATRLFADQGVGQTSTREIAAAADTTERTLFKHYGSKDGLIRAVIDEAVLRHLAPASLDGLRKLIDAHKGNIEAWHVTVLAHRADAAAQAPELARLLLVELMRDDEIRASFAVQWKEAVWRPLVALFTRLEAENLLARDLNVETVARVFLSLNLGYLIARFVVAPELAWNDEDERQTLARFFARGSAPP
ncbi:MAG: TetR/AcrR family transcriptional regulator [Beijerinckiaceae bacterium]